jgi:hypothetical protein
MRLSGNCYLTQNHDTAMVLAGALLKIGQQKRSLTARFFFKALELSPIPVISIWRARENNKPEPR